jgi:CDP-diacylglycerol--glycerol-3-phosphate 3-phosphatidyltransferase
LNDLIVVREYDRDSWSYHAKGLWLYHSEMKNLLITLIGSPNFGYRSSSRDLEAQIALITTDPNLQKKINVVLFVFNIIRS